MTLTRLLYIAEHVKHNILYCILHQLKDELSYWLAEYYTSGYERQCLDDIVRIYYTYYAMTYPSFEFHIVRKSQQWITSPEYEIVSFLAHHLRSKTPRYDIVFQKEALQIKRGRKPRIQTLLKKKDWQGLYHLLLDYPEEDLSTIYTNICQWHDKSVDLEPILERYHTVIPWISLDNHRAMILALAFHLSLGDQEIHVLNTLIVIKRQLHSKYLVLQESQPRHMLQKNVCYSSRQLVSEDEFRDNVTHWDNNRYNCPLWKERIHQYNGKSINNSLVFKSDDDNEAFYEVYGYELDEQPLELQQKLYPFVKFE